MDALGDEQCPFSHETVREIAATYGIPDENQWGPIAVEWDADGRKKAFSEYVDDTMKGLSALSCSSHVSDDDEDDDQGLVGIDSPLNTEDEYSEDSEGSEVSVDDEEEMETIGAHESEFVMITPFRDGLGAGFWPLSAFRMKNTGMPLDQALAKEYVSRLRHVDMFNDRPFADEEKLYRKCEAIVLPGMRRMLSDAGMFTDTIITDSLDWIMATPFAEIWPEINHKFRVGMLFYNDIANHYEPSIRADHDKNGLNQFFSPKTFVKMVHFYVNGHDKELTAKLFNAQTGSRARDLVFRIDTKDHVADWEKPLKDRKKTDTTGLSILQTRDSKSGKSFPITVHYFERRHFAIKRRIRVRSGETGENASLEKVFESASLWVKKIFTDIRESEALEENKDIGRWHVAVGRKTYEVSPELLSIMTDFKPMGDYPYLRILHSIHVPSFNITKVDRLPAVDVDIHSLQDETVGMFKERYIERLLYNEAQSGRGARPAGWKGDPPSELKRKGLLASENLIAAYGETVGLHDIKKLGYYLKGRTPLLEIRIVSCLEDAVDAPPRKRPIMWDPKKHPTIFKRPPPVDDPLPIHVYAEDYHIANPIDQFVMSSILADKIITKCYECHGSTTPPELAKDVPVENILTAAGLMLSSTHKLACQDFSISMELQRNRMASPMDHNGKRSAGIDRYNTLFVLPKRTKERLDKTSRTLAKVKSQTEVDPHHKMAPLEAIRAQWKATNAPAYYHSAFPTIGKSCCKDTEATSLSSRKKFHKLPTELFVDHLKDPKMVSEEMNGVMESIATDIAVSASAIACEKTPEGLDTKTNAYSNAIVSSITGNCLKEEYGGKRHQSTLKHQKTTIGDPIKGRCATALCGVMDKLVLSQAVSEDEAMKCLVGQHLVETSKNLSTVMDAQRTPMKMADFLRKYPQGVPGLSHDEDQPSSAPSMRNCLDDPDFLIEGMAMPDDGHIALIGNTVGGEELQQDDPWFNEVEGGRPDLGELMEEHVIFTARLAEEIFRMANADEDTSVNYQKWNIELYDQFSKWEDVLVHMAMSGQNPLTLASAQRTYGKLREAITIHLGHVEKYFAVAFDNDLWGDTRKKDMKDVADRLLGRNRTDIATLFAKLLGPPESRKEDFADLVRGIKTYWRKHIGCTAKYAQAIYDTKDQYVLWAVLGYGAATARQAISACEKQGYETGRSLMEYYIANRWGPMIDAMDAQQRKMESQKRAIESKKRKARRSREHKKRKMVAGKAHIGDRFGYVPLSRETKSALAEALRVGTIWFVDDSAKWLDSLYMHSLSFAEMKALKAAGTEPTSGQKEAYTTIANQTGALKNELLALFTVDSEWFTILHAMATEGPPALSESDARSKFVRLAAAIRGLIQIMDEYASGIFGIEEEWVGEAKEAKNQVWSARVATVLGLFIELTVAAKDSGRASGHGTFIDIYTDGLAAIRPAGHELFHTGFRRFASALKRLPNADPAPETYAPIPIPIGDDIDNALISPHPEFSDYRNNDVSRNHRSWLSMAKHFAAAVSKEFKAYDVGGTKHHTTEILHRLHRAAPPAASKIGSPLPTAHGTDDLRLTEYVTSFDDDEDEDDDDAV